MTHTSAADVRVSPTRSLDYEAWAGLFGFDGEWSPLLFAHPVKLLQPQSPTAVKPAPRHHSTTVDIDAVRRDVLATTPPDEAVVSEPGIASAINSNTVLATANMTAMARVVDPVRPVTTATTAPARGQKTCAASQAPEASLPKTQTKRQRTAVVLPISFDALHLHTPSLPPPPPLREEAEEEEEETMEGEQDCGDVRGVSYRPRRNNWQAQATVRGHSKKLALGEYATQAIAAAAFNLGRDLILAAGFTVKMQANVGVPQLCDADVSKVRAAVARWRAAV